MLKPTETAWRTRAVASLEQHVVGEPLTDEQELAVGVLHLLALVELADADLLKLEDVAILLHVSRPTVSVLIDDGLLEAVQVGARRRVPRAAVDRYRVENRVQPTARYRMAPRAVTA